MEVSIDALRLFLLVEGYKVMIFYHLFFIYYFEYFYKKALLIYYSVT